MEPATAALILATIKFGYDIAKDLRTRKPQNPEGRKNALRALYLAAGETYRYIEYLRGGGPQKREDERQLSALWRDAAHELYEFNAALADRLFLKADYWLNPEQWSDEDVKNARIGLLQIREEGLDILMPKQ